MKTRTSKLPALLLIVCLMLSLTACGSSGKSGGTTTETETSSMDTSADTAEETDTAEGTDDGDSADDEPEATDEAAEENVSSLSDLYIEEAELYNANGIVFTVNAQDIDLSTGYYYVYFTAQNTGDQNVKLKAKTSASSLNGYMLTGLTGGSLYREDGDSLAPGETAEYQFDLYTSFLESIGSSTFTSLEFYLEIDDADTRDEIATSDLLTVTTSDDSGETPEPAMSEDQRVVYDEGGIRVTERGFYNVDDDLLKVYYLVENDSDDYIVIGGGECYVNGDNVSGSWAITGDVRPGAKLLTYLHIRRSAFEGDVPQSVEFAFNIYEDNMFTGSKIGTSDLITIDDFE